MCDWLQVSPGQLHQVCDRAAAAAAVSAVLAIAAAAPASAEVSHLQDCLLLLVELVG